MRRPWKLWRSLGDRQPDAPATPEPDAGRLGVEPPPVEIAPNDPLVAYFQSAGGPVDLDSLELESPALDQLRATGSRMVVPLVSQGELIGLLNLGPRRSEQEDEIRERERIEQELEVARLIQQRFLPHELPEPPGWHVAAYYQPAREVGGDFYDFLELPDGQLGIVVGDVTDKGVPAALVMATTHSILRAEAPRLVAPGEVLGRV